MVIVRKTSEEMDAAVSQSDWERVKNMRDEDIDYSDCPDITELLAKGLARPVGRSPKETRKDAMTMRLDSATLAECY
jgi:hypothetical protein